MPASATQKGVDRRQEALADIVKNRTEQLATEMREGGSSEEDIAAVTGTAAAISEDDPKRPKDIAPEDWAKMSDEEKGNEIAAAEAALAGETDEQKAERQRQEAEAKAEAERKAAEAAAGASKKVKIKVDGVEQEVDESVALEAGIRTLQKESAADKRLEEATKARDEAERLRKTVEETIARAGGPAADAKKKSEQEMLIAKEGLRDIVKQIQYGSPDEAAQALVEYGNKMASLGQAGRLTETELHNILDLREAQKYVRTEYADVMADANLKELFVGKVNKKLAAGDVRPYQEICKETGDELRAWKAPAKADPTKDAAAAAAAAAGGSRAAAQQRKVSTVSIPAAAVRQQPAATETKAPSNAELVEQARKARGQA